MRELKAAEAALRGRAADNDAACAGLAAAERDARERIAAERARRAGPRSAWAAVAAEAAALRLRGSCLLVMLLLALALEAVLLLAYISVAIERMKEDEILALSRRYFLLGFLFLPWLWLVNFIYVYPVTRKRPELPPAVRSYAMYSLAGSAVWLVIVVAWLSVYLTQRSSWGAIGDRISAYVPIGR
ncbi:hypothetical protein HK105_208949 [Polyrhizophydium stewartii]|uniref:Uncharacterized protein n=1 Tax=Polyrhizophydium stewartii TaxID=2732419 RepID=A0ABR4MWE4_9FUNG